MKTLQNKVAIVTGASRGIGAGIARALAAAGASVVVNYASNRAAADAVVRDIIGAGGRAIAVQADMSKSIDVRRLFADTKAAYGRLDVLVNNAGVYNFGSIESITEAGFRQDFDLNVLGPILATQEALGLFTDDGGSIINISSIVSANPLPQTLVYSATKAALDVATKVLAKELGAKNIRVNSILPGITDTPGNAAGLEGEMGKVMLAATPLGRFGRVEDIGKVAVFLSSPESVWITGETIRVSGGLA